MSKVTNEFSTALAKVIRRHREAKGISLARLAELSGVSQTYPGLLERGERVPTVDVSYSIAKALGVPLSKLIAEAEKVRSR